MIAKTNSKEFIAEVVKSNVLAAIILIDLEVEAVKIDKNLAKANLVKFALNSIVKDKVELSEQELKLIEDLLDFMGAENLESEETDEPYIWSLKIY